MNSLIFKEVARLLQPLLLFFSLFLLVSGHHEPGGGFSGGLVAAISYALHAITFNAAAARRAVGVSLEKLVGVGLLVALVSGLPGLLKGQPFLTADWVEVDITPLGTVELGTPLLFDAGVYLVVLGVTLTFILTLAEE